MASFATTIEEFSDSENRRTYMVSGSTVAAPKLVIQKRRPVTSTTGVAQSTLSIVYGTTDADSVPLEAKVGFEANVRYPANGQSSDVSAALAVFRDFVASDEFTALVNSQSYVQ
jgi:hypothetical protein